MLWADSSTTFNAARPGQSISPWRLPPLPSVHGAASQETREPSEQLLCLPGVADRLGRVLPVGDEAVPHTCKGQLVNRYFKTGDRVELQGEMPVKNWGVEPRSARLTFPSRAHGWHLKNFEEPISAKGPGRRQAAQHATSCRQHHPCETPHEAGAV